MFYSHEILTSREHGVATVWLVATLGSKSSASKVNRKAILDVDVSKACGMIIHPEAPMALRLQGNLLYGVSKVYSQQCGYALVDAQGVKDRMWTMLKTMRSGGLDPDAGKARPEQLVLPHDPSFIPELMLPGLNVELSSPEISDGPQTPHKTSLLSSSHLQTSNKSARLLGGQLGLNLSSSDIGGGGGGGFGGASAMGSSVRKEPEIELPPFRGGEEAGVLLQPDFEIDEEGNIVELPVTRTRKDMPLAERMRSGQGKETEVRDRDREMEDPNQLEEQFPNGGEVEMRDAEDEFRPDNDNLELDGIHANNEESEVPAVQMRQKRKIAKAMDVDDTPELKNADLAQWNSQYLQNMAIASKSKENNKLITAAKKNAAFWVLGVGVASVGMGIGASRTPHPLEVFSGEQLLAALTGQYLGITRHKRSRGAADDDGRNVRQKVGGQEYLRGDGLDDEDGLGFIYDDIEIGREAPSSLHDEHSSQMPWNITASVQSSRHGSALGTRRAGPGRTGRPHSVVSSGADGAANASGAAADTRRGRLTSASPLAHRGAMRSPLDIGGGLGLPHDQDIDLDSLNGVYNLSDDDDGPNAKTGNGQWNSGSLDQESVNFFSFVKERIGRRDNGEAGIKFSSLLPPQSNSRVVATEAFLHVLTLATSGALHVRQKMAVDARGTEDVGGIFIAVSG